MLKTVLPDDVYHSPATVDAVSEIEQTFQVVLPEDIKTLLLEINGVTHKQFGYSLLWSTERITTENKSLRNYIGIAGQAYGPMLFFADAGNGDYFGFKFDDHGRVTSPEVYVWDHEKDSIRIVAPTLAQFIRGWFSGELSI